jgi:hypothetical protein
LSEERYSDFLSLSGDDDVEIRPHSLSIHSYKEKGSSSHQQIEKKTKLLACILVSKAGCSIYSM